MMKQIGTKALLANSFLTTVAGVALLASSGLVSAETLNGAVQKTLDTNPEIGVAKSQRNSARRDIDQAFGGYLPLVDLRGAGGFEDTNSPSTRGRPQVLQRGASNDRSDTRREGQLTVSQLLFDGFATPARVGRAERLADTAANSVRDRTERVGLSAVESYIETLRQRETVRLSEDNIVVHGGYLKLVDEKFKAGRGREADTIQAQGRYAFSQATVIQNQGRLRDIESRYAQVVGDFPGQLERPIAPVDRLADTADGVRAIAADQNPSLAVARTRILAAEQVVREAEAPFYPRLTIEGQGTLASHLNGVVGENNSGSVLGVVRYNLYRGGADLAATRAAKERASEAKEALSQTQRAVDDDVRVSHNAWLTAKARVAKLKDYVAATARVRIAYEQQYNIGERSLFDLLDSENEVFNAKVSLVAAEYAEVFGVYQTLAAAGQLIPTLGVTPPTEIELLK